MPGSETAKENPDNGFDVPSKDNDLERKPGVIVVSKDSKVVEFASQVDATTTLTSQLDEIENQPRDSGKDIDAKRVA